MEKIKEFICAHKWKLILITLLIDAKDPTYGGAS